MASPIAYQNLVTAAMLSSPHAWTVGAPLVNAATRQLTEQAVRNSGGDTEIRIDLGATTTIGYVAILGHNLVVAANAITVRISASATSMTDDTYDYSEVLSTAYLLSVQTPHYGFFLPAAVNVRYVRIRISNLFVPHVVGRVWVGPVLGQAAGQSIDAEASVLGEFVPPIGNDWVLYSKDPTQITVSRGGQAYPRASTRVRCLRCGLYTLTSAQAVGDIGALWDVQRIGEYAGRELPMIVVARTLDPSTSDLYVRHRTMVYGTQTLPWELLHKGGDMYEISLNFEGEN